MAKPIRIGPNNRGPRAGAAPTEAFPNAYPTPIWVTLAVQKRKGLNFRVMKTRIVLYDVFGKPTDIKFPESVAVVHTRGRKGTKGNVRQIKPVPVTGTVVVVIRPKPIRVVSLTEVRKNRPSTHIKFSEVFGKPTTPVKPRGPTTVGQAITRAKIRSKTKTLLERIPTRTVIVVVARPQKIRVLDTIANIKQRRITKSKLNKPFGKPTTRTKIKGPQILSYVAGQTERRVRYVPVKVVVGRVPRTFGTSPTGHVVTFYDGLNVAGGLNYHKGLSRPHLILTSNGDGTFTVFKDVSLTDEKADSILKETYLIDGDIP